MELRLMTFTSRTTVSKWLIFGKLTDLRLSSELTVISIYASKLSDLMANELLARAFKPKDIDSQKHSDGGKLLIY